ncbi:MAG TPA: ATP-binding protein [Actinomycetota bacterium]|jgi:anti-sigma regulatory factor (Ser/Thr protein kinase)|nr:ATP-binding protein [Actinomycetota bacterium]
MSGGLAQAGAVELTLEVRPDAGELAAIRSALGSLAIPRRKLRDARLLVSELVANSIRHSGVPNGRIRIWARVVGDALHVEVVDGGRGAPHPIAGGIRPGPQASSGWGLFLVDVLAERWGHGNGAFWFELGLEST